MYSFNEIIEKLDKLQISHQPVSGVMNMEQLGKRNTTIHCERGMYRFYATEADMSAVLGYAWDTGICVEIDAQGKSKEECNRLIEDNVNKITCLRGGNHSMYASAAQYQPHRIHVYSDNHLDTILDIFAEVRKTGGRRV